MGARRLVSALQSSLSGWGIERPFGIVGDVFGSAGGMKQLQPARCGGASLRLDHGMIILGLIGECSGVMFEGTYPGIHVGRGGLEELSFVGPLPASCLSIKLSGAGVLMTRQRCIVGTMDGTHMAGLSTALACSPG